DTSISLLGAAGVSFIQEAGFELPVEVDGMLMLGRNVFFEPVLHNGDQVQSAVKQAIGAIAAGLPIIIGSHSINYIDPFTAKAALGRTGLSRLLSCLCQYFPDLRFASDRDFLLAWQNRASDWFRAPSAGECVERCRRFLAAGFRRRVFGPSTPMADG